MRYAVLSDIHGNLSALEAVLEDVDKQHVDGLFYLGDAVGYGPDASAVIATLQKRVSQLMCVVKGHNAPRPVWLPGNHEWGLLERANREHFNHDALATLDLTREQIPKNDRDLLAALPTRIDLELGDQFTATLIHAAVVDPIGTMRYIDNAESAAEDMRSHQSQIELVGHTHYPHVFYQDNTRGGSHQRWYGLMLHEDQPTGASFSIQTRRAILNPGSVGQPRDGDPRAAYGILDLADGCFAVQRVTYDVAATQQRLRAWLGGRLATIDHAGGLASRLDAGL